jgi:integrase
MATVAHASLAAREGHHVRSRRSRGPAYDSEGLRHSFGIHAIRFGVPLNLVQRWLGHASMTTTAIYFDALGEEEREIAARMWTRLGGLHAGLEQPVAAVLDLRAGNDAG